jgi:hypothetical protein
MLPFICFVRDHFPTDLLYPQCCHEFHSSTKDSDVHEEYAAEENVLHYDQEIADSHHDSHEDVINIVSNSFIKDDCHDDQIVSFEIFKDYDQITPSENFEHVEHIGILVEDNFRSAEDEEDSLQFPDLKTKANCSTYEESDGGENLKGPDQQSALYVSPAEIPQPTFNRETNELIQQQIKEVFFHDFEDPIANFLDSFNSMNDKNISARRRLSLSSVQTFLLHDMVFIID